jgi:hypothetical protein
MGGACSMHGRNEKCAQSFDWEPEGKRSLRDLGIDRRVILECILGK